MKKKHSKQRNRKLHPQTVTMLRRICKIVFEEPSQFFMSGFYTNDETQLDIPAGCPIANCGTAACVAGWVVALKQRIKPNVAWNRVRALDRFLTKQQLKDANIGMLESSKFWVAGTNILKLSKEQANRLFEFSHWPEEYQHFRNQGTREYAQQAVLRIYHFIETNGRE